MPIANAASAVQQAASSVVQNGSGVAAGIKRVAGAHPILTGVTILGLGYGWYKYRTDAGKSVIPFVG
jgi:hypothetical protein